MSTDERIPESPGPSRTRRSAEEMRQLRQASRLSLPEFARIPLATTASFVVGMGLGLVQGSKMAGLRFRAEHAHKLPQTTTGWYLYHKSKNYHVAFGGIREGLRMGSKISFWTTAMFAIEAMFDKRRGTMDFANTVLACVTVAGGFSAWNRFPLAMAARTTKTALVVGLIYGGLQDMAGLARGRSISYVELVRRQFRQDDIKTSEAQALSRPEGS